MQLDYHAVQYYKSLADQYTQCCEVLLFCNKYCFMLLLKHSEIENIECLVSGCILSGLWWGLHCYLLLWYGIQQLIFSYYFFLFKTFRFSYTSLKTK